MLPTRSSMEFPDFAVAVGEEGSDPVVFHEGRLVRVDQYASSGHYELLETDLKAVADLGVTTWRYGMPWRLTEPEPGVYDWELWDQALAACKNLGLNPIIDLLHFGLPDHYGGFCDGEFVQGFCHYVEAFLERYSEPMWFTPVNEPGITALFSAALGMWNDRKATEDDYFVALGNITLANLEALSRITEDRDGWWIGSEGFGCEVVEAGDAVGQQLGDNARDLQQLVWDLHFGVEPRGVAKRARQVISPQVLNRIDELAQLIPRSRIIAGHDLYPVSVTAYGKRSLRSLSIEDRVAAYDRSARDWFDRYELPFWVSETSNLGLSVEEGPLWLEALMAVLEDLLGDGLPVRGTCWYSRGDQFDWDTALTVPIGKVTEVGLFTNERVPRPVAQAFHELAQRHDVR
jgi:beta-glucosidase/6-phospho-beta-glucosidase/beta-galactosidase